ncbi:MAG: hypothetical protein IJ230_03285 [Clostridia bacterium]|nr:hypothetical protein [Clostridia bacterium]
MGHFNKYSEKKNRWMLTGEFARQGYDWWWHSLTAIDEETGAEKPFFFEYFTCSPKRGGKEPVFGQLPENKKKGKKPSYLMVKAGMWGAPDKMQLHRFFGWKDVKITKKAPFFVEADDCYCDEHHMKGSIHIDSKDAAAHPEWMCDGGDIEWDIEIDPQIAWNVGWGTSPFFLFTKAYDMYWHGNGIKSYYKGWIKANGKKYRVEPETCYGYEDKNWGRDFTTPWVWLSSNNLTSNITGKKLENSVFEIGGGRPVVYHIPLPRQLLGCFYYEGEEFEFNFSKFWELSTTKFSFDEDDEEVHWHVRQSTKKGILITELHCKKEDMLLVNYESPDGEKRFGTLWNGGNGYGDLKLYRRKFWFFKKLVDDIHATNIGCEYGEYDY